MCYDPDADSDFLPVLESSHEILYYFDILAEDISFPSPGCSSESRVKQGRMTQRKAHACLRSLSPPPKVVGKSVEKNRRSADPVALGGELWASRSTIARPDLAGERGVAAGVRLR
jgi:hypothetical protein